MRLRDDLELISSWIKDSSRVLDLGCGDGHLLKLLKEDKNVSGYGIDNNIDQIKSSINNNISVLQLDLDDGLDEFKDNSFDYVVLAQSLQEVKKPEKLLNEMLRIGKEVIISFPNMGHWTSRFQLLFSGRMPMTRELPYSWHETPNIHLCTINDFLKFCEKNNFKVIDKSISTYSFLDNIMVNFSNNFFGSVATFRIK